MRQEDVALKGELPWSVGAQHAAGEEWRRSSRESEGAEPKQNSAQLWMWLVMEVKSDAVKNSIA